MTGGPALFVSRQHPVLTCGIRCTPNVVVAWDNRSTRRQTLQDFEPKCLSGHHISFAGEPPARWDD